MSIGIDKSDWKKTTFGAVCRNLNISERDPLSKGLDRYVGLEHIETDNLHIRSWGNVSEGTTFTKKFLPGHVLFGKRRAYLRKAAVADFEGLCSGDILVFEANEEVMHPRLLPFLVSSDRFFDYAVQTSAGSLSPRTKFQDLEKFAFLLPPKEQQERLADLLWAGDEVVERYIGLNKQLNKFKKRFLLDVFNQSSRLKKLESIAFISYGIGVLPKTNGSGVPIIRATNIKRGEIFSEDLIKAIPSDISLGKRVFLDEGDIIVVRSGAYTGDVGYINLFWAGSLAGYDLVIKPDRQLINPQFLKEFLLSDVCQSYFKSESTRSAQPHLNAEQLRETLIPDIPIEKQDNIAQEVNKLSSCISECLMAINISKAAHNAFVNQIFSPKNA